MRNDKKGRVTHHSRHGIVTMYASGARGPEVRADGKGGRLRRGYHGMNDLSGEIIGPFTTRENAVYGVMRDRERVRAAYRAAHNIPAARVVSNATVRGWVEEGRRNKRRAARAADVMRAEAPSLLSLYRGLHDGLSDMIEGGRLTESDVPDDYQWLVETLAACAAADDRESRA